jgi:Tfp pilus assembly protein PilX
MNVPVRNPNERGIALVIALLVLMVITMLAVVMMMTVTMERRTAGHDMRASEALNVAEAGVNEAVSLIRHQDINLSPANPRAVAQVFLASAGSVPSLGTDSVGVATKQPAGSWLPYSTAGRSPDALTVAFKTDAAKTDVYRYDATVTPNVHLGGSGLPIYEITSTGTTGSARRRVVTDVIQKPFYLNAKGALAAGQPINFIGNAIVCGYNHSADTPNDAGMNGRDVNPQCHVPWETASGDLVAAWSTGVVQNGGAAYQAGAAPVWATNQTGFYTGPWDAFNMSQADFLGWIGAPVNGVPGNLNGIYYIDNNSIPGDQSKNVGIHGGDGEGLLYVDGDLTINAQFYYRGLIYVEGDLTMNGQAWVLGGVIVKGRSTVRQNGGATILYSSDAITRALAKYGGQFVTLSWRELQP